MAGFQLSFKYFGEKALLIEWPQEINEVILEDIISLQQYLESKLKIYIVECIPAYQSLTIVFNPEEIEYTELVRQVQLAYADKQKSVKVTSRRWHIPVCYDPHFGIDLQTISNNIKLDVGSIIKLHVVPDYIVHFIGFLPGFPYLGGLPEILHTPRKPIPSVSIPKGSVAIAGAQTGIYPMESPGGWNIIGSTPISLFDPQKQPPCLAMPGDRIKFYSISLKEYKDLKERSKMGNNICRMEIIE